LREERKGSREEKKGLREEKKGKERLSILAQGNGLERKDLHSMGSLMQKFVFQETGHTLFAAFGPNSQAQWACF
jgi:hypothetical protein